MAQSPTMVLPIGHTSHINSVDISSNGKLLLTASSDNTIKIWDIHTGYILKDISAHKSEIVSAMFSSDGKTILSCSWDKTAKLWDTETGKLLFDFIGHEEGVYSAQFSHDGNKIVTASFDSTAKIWDVKTGVLLFTLKGHKDAVIYAEFSPDDRNVVTASWDRSVKIWNAYNGNLLFNLYGIKGYITSTHYSHNGKFIVTASRDNRAKIWNAETGELLNQYRGGLNKSVNFALFSPDDKQLLTSFGRGTKIWDVKTGKKIATTKRHHAATMNAIYSNLGNKIITYSFENDAKIWDAKNGKIYATLLGHTGEIKSAKFSADEKSVVTCATDQSARLWDATTGKLLMVFKGHTQDIWQADFSKNFCDSIHPEPSIFIIYDKNIKIKDAYRGNVLADLSGHKMEITSVALSVDGTHLASASNDKTGRLWDAKTGKLIAELTGHRDYVNDIKFSPDGKVIVTSSLDNTAKIWDAQNGTLLHTLQGHKDWVTTSEFSPDGTKLLTISNDKTARLWDIKTGILLFVFGGHPTDLEFGVFSPKCADDIQGGSVIITASDDSFVRVWNSKTGLLISDLFGHTKRITSASFSRNGNQIITTSEDSTMKIWDIKTGNIISDFKTFNYPLRSAEINSMSPNQSPGDERILITSYYCNQAYLWDFNAQRKIADLAGDWSKWSMDGKYIATIMNDNSAGIWDGKTGKQIAKLSGHQNSIRTLQFMPDGKSILTNSYDHTSKVWDLNTGKLLYTFFAIDSLDYFNQIPEGYYQCTPNAAKLIHYVTKDLKIITFEQFDVKLNRPDKVLKAMGCTDTNLINSYQRAYQKRIKKLNIDTTAFRDGYSVPEADFSQRDSITYEQKNEILKLRIHGFDLKYNLERFNIWVNEVPVFGLRGVSIKYLNSLTLDTFITIKLSQGENRIETSVTNINGIESYRIPLFVKYIPIKFQPGMHYFIGIGIDQFSDSRYNLKYSTKDIRDLCLKLKAKYGSNLKIDTLFNENVTLENVRLLKTKLLQTNVDDQVIISYSGHGLLSSDYDYFLSTYKINFDKPEEDGLPYDELERLLDSIPARQKLLLIDACHSGEVDKDEMIAITKSANAEGLKGSQIIAYPHTEQVGLGNSFELMQSLFVNVGKNTGTIIISAAAGNQFALESGKWNNGVFTYSILDALDKYPTIKISQLKQIVGQQVESLTHGLQKPTFRNETIDVDWNVW